jgi:phage-related protein
LVYYSVSYIVNLSEEATDFIESIPDLKLKAKTFRTLDLLQEFGPFLSMPHSKNVQNGEGLNELRTQQSNNIVRLFYFFLKDNIYIVTSGYIKKDQKLKKGEIDRAINFMKKIQEKCK